MSDLDDLDIDRRLAELGRATEPLGARPGFNQRVMAAIHAQPSGFWGELLASSRWAIGASLVAALLAVGLAYQAESSANEALAVSYDAAEVPW